MHNIHYITCDEKVSKTSIMAEIQEQAELDGDGYCSKFTWHDNIKPFDSYEKAEQFIKTVDNGWYDDHAVRYKDYSHVKSAKVDEYEAKIAELRKAQGEYEKIHSARSFSAKYIGCSKCGSKLNKAFLIGELCPVCVSDLRSQTTLEKIRWYEDKIKDYRNRIQAEKMKQEKKAKIKWLIKYEYHS